MFRFLFQKTKQYIVILGDNQLLTFVQTLITLIHLDLHNPNLSQQKLAIKKTENGYWSFPPVGERHLVRTAMECGLICMNTAGCFYFNVERIQPDKNALRYCDITNTVLLTSNVDSSIIPHLNWDVYTIIWEQFGEQWQWCVCRLSVEVNGSTWQAFAFNEIQNYVTWDLSLKFFLKK